MTSQDFLYRLEKSLGNISQEDKDDILFDYREHFRIGLLEGKSELDIAKALGQPEQIARQFRAETMLKEASSSKSVSNMVNAIFASLGLGFFNLFFGIWPFVVFFFVLLGFYVAAFSIIFAGIIGFVATIFSTPILGFVEITILLLTFVFVICLGLLFLIGVYYLTRMIYDLTLRYLRWNISIVSKKNKDFASNTIIKEDF